MKIVKAIPWHRDVPISTSDLIEDLICVPRSENGVFEDIDRFKLESWRPEMTNFRPQLVNLQSLSPNTLKERLATIGLVPAPLRHYMSFRSNIEKNGDVLGDKSLIYVGEILPDGIIPNYWKTFSFFQSSDGYEGMLNSVYTYPDSFLTPSKFERDYNYTRYAVAMLPD